jgi:DNA transformation protein and related proteins
MADERLRDYVLEQLDGLGVASRAMFGGHGLYLDGAFFGIITGGRLYFRTDEETRPAYVEQGMTALQPRDRPRGPRTVDRNFEVPAEVMEERALLISWALRAADAARKHA